MTTRRTKPRLRAALLGFRLGCFALGLAAPALACTNIPPEPPSSTSIGAPSDARLRWLPMAGAQTYRVQVRLSHPEGPTLRTLDVQTADTELRLSPLPETALINVQALIGVACDQRNMDDLLATRPVFTLRQTLSCHIGSLLPHWQGNRLGWDALPGAQTYRVRVVATPVPVVGSAVDSGNLPPSLEELAPSRETPVASVDLPDLVAEPDKLHKAVVLVQPVCQGKPGSPAAARLPLPPPSAPAR